MIAVVAWTAVFLLAIDVALNFLFAMPADPREPPSAVQRYFDYGRSVESKLRYLVRNTDAVSGPIATSGWTSTVPAQPTAPREPGSCFVAVYGQSMSHRLAHEMKSLDPSLTLRLVGGPGAPLSHTYDLYVRDRGRHSAGVVLIGVVASGLRYLSSMTTMTWGFEVPAPYTYPRWSLSNDELVAVQPVVDSLDGLRHALRDPAAWQRFVGQLREHDLMFDGSLFEADLVDFSALGRCMRRAQGQRHQDEIDERYFSAEGFKDSDHIVTIARRLLLRFVSDIREDGRVPIVVLLHDRGFKDHLHLAVADALRRNDVAFFSSHEVASAEDPANYLPDGHFIRDIDVRMAYRVLELVRSAQNGRAGD